ncbi:MAG: hypothetical protein L3V56_12475 [Candidatus Magnetoovum sp. WYHC-5]|nr:hypothetical protein [Candidatus Magnetoovum sp. WYHC-5]
MEFKRNEFFSISIFLLLIVAFIVFPVISYAKEISYSLPCADGGTKSATGTYDPKTGAYTISVILDNCVKGGITFNGTVYSSGTIKSSIYTPSIYDISTNTSYNNLSASKNGSYFNISCTRSVAGQYDSDSYVLSGSANTVCSEAGNISADLESIVTEILSSFYE